MLSAYLQAKQQSSVFLLTKMVINLLTIRQKKIVISLPSKILCHLQLTDTYHISSDIRRFFSLPKQSQNLDPSYKTDLDLWDCLGRVKLVL